MSSGHAGPKWSTLSPVGKASRMERGTRKAEIIRNNADEIRGGAFSNAEHAAETGKTPGGGEKCRVEAETSGAVGVGQ